MMLSGNARFVLAQQKGTSKNCRERAKFAPRSGPFTFTQRKASTGGAKFDRVASFEKFPKRQSLLSTDFSKSFVLEMPVE
jgi:hypothetical protein